MFHPLHVLTIERYSASAIHKVISGLFGSTFFTFFFFFVQILKGQLFVDKFIEKTQYSFLDYISSGFELNFMVAIDFTGAQLVMTHFLFNSYN